MMVKRERSRQAACQSLIDVRAGKGEIRLWASVDRPSVRRTDQRAEREEEVPLARWERNHIFCEQQNIRVIL